MNRRLKRIILFSTAILAFGTIGGTATSVSANTMYIPNHTSVNQYVARNKSKIMKEMNRQSREDFNDMYATPDQHNNISYYDGAIMGYLLLHPKTRLAKNNNSDIPIYANGNPLKNGYRNYLTGSHHIYAKPGRRKNNRRIIRERTFNRLVNNYIPFKVLRRVHTYRGRYYKIHFKSGLTGWIKNSGIFSMNSYPKMQRYLGAYYGYFQAVNSKKRASRASKTRRAKAYKRVNRQIARFINASAYSVYRNHYHMTETARYDLPRAIGLVNSYRRFRHVLRYTPAVYMNAIREARKGRIATRYNKRSVITSSKRATLYNIRHTNLVA